MKLTERRIVIAGTGSGCGKTTVTSGLLQCLRDRGIKTASFKCGPDYIDPMFHESVLGAKSGNLDLFFSDEEMLRCLAAAGARECEISVAEGVMGYYDGVGLTDRASTYRVAAALQAPVILVIGARGMASSILAVLEGFLHHRADSNIRGVIFNRLPAKLYGRLAEQTARLGVEPLGYLPSDSRVEIGSRHLGLVTAGEIRDLKQRLRILADQMEKTVDVEGILRLAEKAPSLEAELPAPLAEAAERVRIFSAEISRPPVIAVAKDEAFCFTYRENLEILRQLGAEIVFFSPLRDERLPEHADGMLISGGYPELYARELSENETMKASVRAAAEDGMPLIAECGGFMYLHRSLESAEKSAADTPGKSRGDFESHRGQGCRASRGKMYDMAGVVDGICYRKERLGNFGYLVLTSAEDGMLLAAGGKLKAHEFHYWESTCGGDGFLAEKADGSRSWSCGISGENMYAGFPHLFFPSVPEAAERFVRRCAAYRMRKRAQKDRSGAEVAKQEGRE